MHDLAQAKNDDVLRLWQGLGYYNRARNMHKCAKIIVDEYNGAFPSTMKALLTLPGIGRYTAAAIASLAFNEAVPVVDGNVYRVMARYFGIDIDITSGKAYDYFYQLSLSFIDKTQPANYNQAVMEFGAIFCVPQQPNCENCVLKQGCVAFSKGTQHQYPVKKKKPKKTKRHFTYLIMQNGDHFLMRQRKDKDIWPGLFEFMLIETSRKQNLDLIEHPVLEKLRNSKAIIDIDEKNIQHVLTHQLLSVNFVVVNLDNEQDLARELITDNYQWYNWQAAENLPKPILLANYLHKRMKSINLQ